MIYLKGDGVPKVYCYGNDNKNNILVMELLGKCLDTYYTECGKKFKISTVCYQIFNFRKIFTKLF